MEILQAKTLAKARENEIEISSVIGCLLHARIATELIKF